MRPYRNGILRSRCTNSCEALAKLAKLDQALATRLTDHKRIIAFRNILIHGYADVDDRLVWDVVETKLPVVRQEIDALLAE